MKKNRILIFAAALALLGSCTKDEVNESKEQSTSTSSSSSATNTSSSSAKKTDKSEGGDYFDIPAFLRKQAD